MNSRITEKRILYFGKEWLKRKNYNGQIIKSEKVRLWYDHFKKTGEKLNIKTIEVDMERIKHLFMK